jgi:hypothetical protein
VIVEKIESPDDARHRQLDSLKVARKFDGVAIACARRGVAQDKTPVQGRGFFIETPQHASAKLRDSGMAIARAGHYYCEREILVVL